MSDSPHQPIHQTLDQRSEISDQRSLVVLGAGVAGIAAAVRLAEHGLPVTLIETRKKLGGRATSFLDPATGIELDNSQHVLLGCCTHLIDLYRRLGVERHIQWHRRLHFIDARRARPDDPHDRLPPIDTLEADDLPAPLHLARSLLGLGFLRWSDKLAIARGMNALLRLGRDGRNAWHDRSFADWLRAQRQPASAVKLFWANIVVGACNEPPERIAAHAAMQVFQEGFLAHQDAYLLGLSRIPLARLYDRCRSILQHAGGRLLTGAAVTGLEIHDQQIRAVILDDPRRPDLRRIPADLVVSALPWDRLSRILPQDAARHDHRLRHLDRWRVSPIMGIHLLVARSDRRPVMTLPHVSILNSPLHWAFHKGTVQVPGADGPRPATLVSCVISAAREAADRSAEQNARIAMTELARILPGFRGATLLHHRVVTEKRATFSLQPHTAHWRPPCAPSPPRAGASAPDSPPPHTHLPLANLLLAGDWTDTGWPATMEGAARSGNTAAGAALRLLGRPGFRPPDDLPPSALCRFLAD